MKVLAIVIFALGLSGCGTLGGIASDVNAFNNVRYGGNYYGPPGQYYKYNRGWRQSRRWHR